MSVCHVITGYTVSPGDCILLGILHVAHVLCPCVGWPYTPHGCGDSSVGAVWSPTCCVRWVARCRDLHFLCMFCNLWGVSGPCSGILGAQRACSHLSIPALGSAQWPLFAFRAGEQPLAWEEQSPEPVPANTKHAFLSLRDKLVCQQQEVMLLPSSPRGNSLWFPWGCMQL